MALLRVWFLTVCAIPVFSRRNLTEITYRFTNCDSTNQDGPRVIENCVPLYEEMSSQIANPGTLFEFENGLYDGAQGFRLPRDGLYNITVAGASGGEGVCNYHHGFGGVISAQVRLTTDYEYLIMVGHRGTSVCDVPENTNHPICQLPRPTNLGEVQICTNNWLNWTAMFDNSQDRYNYNGGGGGGGASMIWPRRADNKEFTDLPIVISPGGGGASAILEYEFVAGVLDLLKNNLSLKFPARDPSLYTSHTNGHISQYALNWPEGVRGFRASDAPNTTSGAGGGWDPQLILPLLSIDGKLLSQQVNFAEGGIGCSASPVEPDTSTFINAFGGYGGGGGGCGSGGGGGGYTGGHVHNNANRFPGSGGDAGVFNQSELLLTKTSDLLGFNEGDGYVEIVASNCGCDGECVVYTEERQFECQCPNGTLLAEDESSCYQEMNITFSQLSSFSLNFNDNGNPFFISGLQFTNSSFSIFGLDVSLTVSPSPGSGLSPEEVACAVVFVGQNSSSVLASNPVRNGTGQANELTMLGSIGNGGCNFGPITTYTDFLGSPILVTGAFLLTNGECSLASPFGVSVQIHSEDEASLFEDFAALEQDAVTNACSARLVLGVRTAIGLNNVIIGSVVGSILFVIVSALGVIFCLWICLRSKAKKSYNVPRAYDGYGTNPVHQETSFNHRRVPDTNRTNYEELFSSILVPYSSLTLGEEIGHGTFGTVHEGKFKSPYTGAMEDIAIKTTKELTSPREQKAFFEESSLMMGFNHPNILGLMGVCFDTPDGSPFILLPLMANGSLKDYLKNKRTHVTNVDTLPEDLTLPALIRMCMDIASGMEYLAGEKFVHRDLAARNCMVDSSLQIKVGDFGLARDVYTEDYYRASKEAMLPVKWMAPETLFDRISNEKTDVWSYGVTCWEVFSLARTPYPGIPNSEVLNHITKEKKRLENPSLCPRKMYSLAMSQCWQLLPEERPTFSQLVCQLQEYWEDEHAYEHAYSPVTNEDFLC